MRSTWSRRVDRLLRRRARALSARARRRCCRGQPAARAHPPPARQERPDRRRAGRPSVAGRQGHRGPEADRRDRRVDPAAARRPPERREVPQRRDRPARRADHHRPATSSATSSPAARRSAARPRSAADCDPRSTSFADPSHAAKFALRSIAHRIDVLSTARSPSSTAQLEQLVRARRAAHHPAARDLDRPRRPAARHRWAEHRPAPRRGRVRRALRRQPGPRLLGQNQPATASTTAATAKPTEPCT